MRKQKIIQHALIVVVVGLFAVVFAMPIFVTLTNSLMTGFEITNRYTMTLLPTNVFYRLDAFPHIHFVRMTMLPSWFSLSQYWALFQDAGYMSALWNSIIITAPAIAGQLLVAAPAAYAFEVSKWRHKEKLFFVYMVVMLMPLPVVLVPQFIMAQFMGISESVLAVILPAMFSPFGVFLLRQFMKNLPHEYLEAAKLDGAGQIRLLFSIVVPLMKPAIAALALLVFIDYWNVVDQAIVFITDPAWEPLSVMLSRIIRSYDIIFAASFFFMIPSILVLLHGQEHFKEGLRLSGLK